MKYLLTALIAILLIVGAVAWYTTGTANGATIAQMSLSCEQKQTLCKSLINKVQAHNKYQVYADSEGHYWAEVK